MLVSSNKFQGWGGISEMAQDDCAACMSWRGDEESDGEALSMPYQKRREQLCINGEALRVPLLQSSIRMEGLIPLKYVGGDYDWDGQTWCWDCSFGAYYCIKCCNELHRLKHRFYSPQALKVSVFRIFKLTKLIFSFFNGAPKKEASSFATLCLTMKTLQTFYCV